MKNDYVLSVTNFSVPTPTKYVYNLYIYQFAYKHYAYRKPWCLAYPAINISNKKFFKSGTLSMTSARYFSILQT